MRSKHNKKKCRKCKYHGKDGNMTYCNHAGLTGDTCLKKEGSGIIDTRGNDYNNCLLYEKGAPRPLNKISLIS